MKMTSNPDYLVLSLDILLGKDFRDFSWTKKPLTSYNFTILRKLPLESLFCKHFTDRGSPVMGGTT
jgi:hypothetical protein